MEQPNSSDEEESWLAFLLDRPLVDVQRLCGKSLANAADNSTGLAVEAPVVATAVTKAALQTDSGEGKTNLIPVGIVGNEVRATHNHIGGDLIPAGATDGDGVVSDTFPLDAPELDEKLMRYLDSDRFDFGEYMARDLQLVSQDIYAFRSAAKASPPLPVDPPGFRTISMRQAPFLPRYLPPPPVQFPARVICASASSSSSSSAKCILPESGSVCHRIVLPGPNFAERVHYQIERYCSFNLELDVSTLWFG
jgi:hypothetical protein